MVDSAQSVSPRSSALAGSTSLFEDASGLLAQPEDLRRKAEADGFLFFKGLLPREDVLELRRALLGVVEKYGWRSPGQDALGGQIDLESLNRVPHAEMRTDIGVSIDAYHDVQRLREMHALPHHPRLIALYRALFGGRDVLVHPRHIVRMITGHECMVPTPPHQDFPLIQGTSHTWTCWFPLGDCPRSLGALTVLRGSHRAGYVPIEPALGAGRIAVQLCPNETDWVRGDFEIGDVLTFTCYTVHKALPSQSRREIRLSMDVRYQPIDEPLEEKSLLPHCPLTWEQIYADWAGDDPLKYYWRNHSLQKSPWDANLLQPSRRIC